MQVMYYEHEIQVHLFNFSTNLYNESHKMLYVVYFYESINYQQSELYNFYKYAFLLLISLINNYTHIIDYYVEAPFKYKNDSIIPFGPIQSFSTILLWGLHSDNLIFRWIRVIFKATPKKIPSIVPLCLTTLEFASYRDNYCNKIEKPILSSKRHFTPHVCLEHVASNFWLLVDSFFWKNRVD